MPNPLPIDLKDGKPRALNFTMPGIDAFERHHGARHIVRIILEEQWRLGITASLIWAGLLWQEPELKRADIDAVLDFYVEHGGDLDALREPLTEALCRAKVLRRMEVTDKAADPSTAPRANGSALGTSEPGQSSAVPTESDQQTPMH
jgi:hypothetical protein